MPLLLEIKRTSSEQPMWLQTACLYFNALRKAPLLDVPNFTYLLSISPLYVAQYRPSPEEMKVLHRINQRIIYSYTAGTFLMALPGVLGKGCWVRTFCPRPPPTVVFCIVRSLDELSNIAGSLQLFAVCLDPCFCSKLSDAVPPLKGDKDWTNSLCRS
jgi:hypothetical protein